MRKNVFRFFAIFTIGIAFTLSSVKAGAKVHQWAGKKMHQFKGQ